MPMPSGATSAQVAHPELEPKSREYTFESAPITTNRAWWSESSVPSIVEAAVVLGRFCRIQAAGVPGVHEVTRMAPLGVDATICLPAAWKRLNVTPGNTS